MYDWTLDSAVQFVRELEEALAPNYHVALAGSTLHKGYSDNDLDVLIIPHSSDHNQYGEVKSLLEAFGMQRKVKCSLVHKKWNRGGSTDTKFVEVWYHQGFKVDVFQLSPESSAKANRDKYFQGLLQDAVPGDTVLDEGTGAEYTLHEGGVWKLGL